jgi:hypothetical protein
MVSRTWFGEPKASHARECTRHPPPPRDAICWCSELSMACAEGIRRTAVRGAKKESSLKYASRRGRTERGAARLAHLELGERAARSGAPFEAGLGRGCQHDHDMRRG